MNTETVTTPEQTTALQAEPVQEPKPADKPLSIAEHAAQFGEKAKAEPTEPAAEPKPHHAAEQKRDKDNGQFEPGKVRHRAASQKASPEDVPRIQKLTGERNDAIARAERAERELSQLRAQGAPKREIAAAEAKVDRAGGFSEPEPSDADLDTKYGGDYGRLMMAKAEWAGRKAYHAEKQRERDEADRASRQSEQQRVLTDFGKRIDRGRAKYQDFDAVALETRAPWPANSLIDAFIMEDDNGEEILYHLLHPTNRQELDALLAKPMFGQNKHLALLSQRLAPESSEQAGGTGSVATRETIVRVLPKPPNPVRTEAQRASDDPPEDRPLSIAEHSKHYGKALGRR